MGDSLDGIKLVIFDMDGTLVEAFTGTTLLPKVAAKIAELEAQGIRAAVATNQGGPACRFAGWQGDYPSVAAVRGRVLTVLQHLRLAQRLAYPSPWIPTHRPVAAVSYAYVDKNGVALTDLEQPLFSIDESHRIGIYETDEVEARKPSSGMIWLLIGLVGDVRREEVLFVGDMESDRLAAENGDVRFAWAKAFFGWDN